MNSKILLPAFLLSESLACAPKTVEQQTGFEIVHNENCESPSAIYTCIKEEVAKRVKVACGDYPAETISSVVVLFSDVNTYREAMCIEQAIYTTRADFGELHGKGIWCSSREVRDLEGYPLNMVYAACDYAGMLEDIDQDHLRKNVEEKIKNGEVRRMDYVVENVQ